GVYRRATCNERCSAVQDVNDIGVLGVNLGHTCLLTAAGVHHVAFALVEEHGTLIECCLHLLPVEKCHWCRTAGHCRGGRHRQFLILLGAGRSAHTYRSDNLAIDG